MALGTNRDYKKSHDAIQRALDFFESRKSELIDKFSLPEEEANHKAFKEARLINSLTVKQQNILKRIRDQYKLVSFSLGGGVISIYYNDGTGQICEVYNGRGKALHEKK